MNKKQNKEEQEQEETASDIRFSLCLGMFKRFCFVSWILLPVRFWGCGVEGVRGEGGGSAGRVVGLIRVVSLEWNFISAVSLEVGLSSKWSFGRVVYRQGGSPTRVVGGLQSLVVFQQCGLSSG